MKTIGSKLWHYSVFGVVFGAFFPFIAFLMSLSKQGESLSWVNILNLHSDNNLFYIIDLAPLVVGVLFSIIGIGNIQKLEYLISISKLERDLRDKEYQPERKLALKKIHRNYVTVLLIITGIVVVGNFSLINIFFHQKESALKLEQIYTGVNDQINQQNQTGDNPSKESLTKYNQEFQELNTFQKSQPTRLILVASIAVLVVITLIVYTHFFVFAPNFLTLHKGVMENTIAKKLIQEHSKENERLLHEMSTNMETAKFIQRSLNQSSKKIKEFFDESFIVNRPLQVLSGDYIWFKQISSTKALFCLGDCVGHGVAGSLLSSLYVTFLESITKISARPDDIIIAMDRKMKDHLSKFDIKNDEFTCEAGILLIDKEKRSIQFAGSNTELVIQNGEIKIVKSARFSIGSARNQEKPQLLEFELDEGTWLILTSDGFKNMLNQSQNRLGIKGVQNLLGTCEHEDGDLFGIQLKREIDTYIKDSIRNDDILITGIKL